VVGMDPGAPGAAPGRRGPRSLPPARAGGAVDNDALPQNPAHISVPTSLLDRTGPTSSRDGGRIGPRQSSSGSSAASTREVTSPGSPSRFSTACPTRSHARQYHTFQQVAGVKTEVSARVRPQGGCATLASLEYGNRRGDSARDPEPGVNADSSTAGTTQRGHPRATRIFLGSVCTVRRWTRTRARPRVIRSTTATAPPTRRVRCARAKSMPAFDPAARPGSDRWTVAPPERLGHQVDSPVRDASPCGHAAAAAPRARARRHHQALSATDARPTAAVSRNRDGADHR